MTGARAGPLALLGIFAAAMGYVEAAVVVYLRRIYLPGGRLSLFPLQGMDPADLAVELGREAATVVMIVAVSLVAASGRVRRLAAFLFVFGVWDLGYYLWLKVLAGWPASWGEWDVLFLIPWVWLAPWYTPALVAALFAAWGAAVLASAREHALSRGAVALAVAGLGLVQASFLEPALSLPGDGLESGGGFEPDGFPWALYLPGLALLAAGLLAALRSPPAPPREG